MFVFFDIGATLIEGPASNPADEIVGSLALPPDARQGIHDLIFRTPVDDIDPLVCKISEEFSVRRDIVAPVLAGIWDGQVAAPRAIEGGHDAINGLVEAGFDYGYISNIWAPYLKGFLNLYPEESSRPMFLSYKCGVEKPDTSFYLKALTAIGGRAEDTVMIGDSYENDMAPALEVGMKAIWLLHRLEKEKADIIRVVNGQAIAPNRTLGSIGELAGDVLCELLAM